MEIMVPMKVSYKYGEKYAIKSNKYATNSSIFILINNTYALGTIIMDLIVFFSQ